MGRDAVQRGVGLILTGDFPAGFGAGLVAHGDGQPEGHLIKCFGRFHQNCAAQPVLKIADVAFGRGFGQAVQPVGPGAQGGQIGLPVGEPPPQRRQTAWRDVVGVG